MNHAGNDEHGLWDQISTLAFVTSVCIGYFGCLAMKMKDGPDNFNPKLPRTTTPSNKKELPSHVQRELYKEDRREIMRPRITRKSPMYDNIRMLDVDGNVLSTISQKKAQWYLKHPAQLAKEIDSHTIQLNFLPNKHNQQDDDDDRLITEYNASIKRNCCVGCGDETSFMRHYVVPYCYRSRFPNAFKTHMPHDVVILCPHCYMHAERAAHHRMKFMESQLRKEQNYSPETAQPEVFDPLKQSIRNAATALSKWKTKLPPIKIQEYELLIAEYYHVDYQQQQSIPENIIQEACQLKTRKPNPNYVSGVDLVIDSLLLKHPRTSKTDPENNGNNHGCRDNAEAFDQVLLTQFIREWRKNFVESIQPRFLPTAWSVNAPVQCHHSR